MAEIKVMIPEVDWEIEACLRSERGTRALAAALEHKGVKSDPPITELDLDDMRRATRCIFIELKKREAH